VNEAILGLVWNTGLRNIGKEENMGIERYGRSKTEDWKNTGIL